MANCEKVTMPTRKHVTRNETPTLKERIRSEIETKIFSGKWPPGYRIPNEHSLAKAYGCSRMTVNQVLSELAGKSFIERRRKAGSFVGRPVVQSAVLRIPEIKSEVEALGLIYRYELLYMRSRKATARDRNLMQLGPNGRLVEFRCRHWANEQPFAYEHRFLNLSAVPEALEQDFETIPPGSWLLHHVPWTEAEHCISAMDSEPDVARSLRIGRGTACLVVLRRTWRAGDMITHVRSFFPGNHYQLSAHFTPTRG
jgi:GntR family transcriptional regulator, histidine utilization repressor